MPAPVEYSLPDARVTLDTEDDYRYLQEIFDELYRGKPLEIELLIPYLRSNKRIFSAAVREG